MSTSEKNFRPARGRRWILLALLPLLLAACGASAPAAAPAAHTIRAATTMSVLADMIRRVGGERVQVTNIIPVGAGPEDYQPSPDDARALAEADIVFYNGHGLEEWLADLLHNAARPGQPQVAVSEGLPALGANDEFREGNPHFWMSAALGARYLEKIRDGLIGIDPDGRATYTANAAAYSKELLALNEELKQQAAALPPESRKIVTNHDALPYFAQEYGFTIVGNLLGSAESEPSAGDLVALVQQIKAQNVKAVFSESQFSPQLTATIAREAGVKVVANLYTDTLGEAGSGVASYADMLRYDMRTIVDALQ
jgi:ABC-type Zn uptake system ZnuABC Zn-binding protein ZnuA